jgi:hypothetical protein
VVEHLPNKCETQYCQKEKGKTIKVVAMVNTPPHSVGLELISLGKAFTLACFFMVYLLWNDHLMSQ